MGAREGRQVADECGRSSGLRGALPNSLHLHELTSARTSFGLLHEPVDTTARLKTVDINARRANALGSSFCDQSLRKNCER